MQKMLPWGIANKRNAAARIKRPRVQTAEVPPVRGPRIGSTVRISGLTQARQYSGCHAEVLSAEDDAGRIVVLVQDKQLRLQASKLCCMTGD
jgi:hypothetical protein